MIEFYPKIKKVGYKMGYSKKKYRINGLFMRYSWRRWRDLNPEKGVLYNRVI